MRVLQQAGPVQLGAEFVASSLRYDDAADTREDGRLRHPQPHRRVAIRKGLFACSLRGDNVFNKNYQLAADYSMGGATVFAGIRWQP